MEARLNILNIQGVPKKKDILNMHIKSEGINIFFHKNFAGQSLSYTWSNVKSSHL